MNRSLLILTFLLALSPILVKAQTDTLEFSNGELVVGEIKSLSRGVITIETSYSDSDFQIEWTAVSRIRSQQNYLTYLDDGRRLNATINSTEGINVRVDDGTNAFTVELLDIVELKPIDDSFWDRVSASVDVGLNLTKANNLTQFNSRVYLGYLTEKWEISGTYNNVYSSQDSVPDTRRMDANLAFTLFLVKDWFLGVSNDFLQNDEQKLALRSTTKVGVGNYIVNTNALYLSLFAGAAFNNETYIENANPDRQTGEAFIGIEYNMFNTGDLSLQTSTFAYPNLTDQGRVRVDFRFDIKYDLPLDFYVKAGTTVNYDNRPVAGASDLDYVIQTGIGWEW
jgi:hypothetical protein